MLTIIKKSWYQKNRQRLSEQRKRRYVEDAGYRQRAVESSRRYRRGEDTAPPPADASISLTEALERLDIGDSTLREWRRKKLVPESKRYQRRIWFTETQVALLKTVKEFNQKYRMRPFKIRQAPEKELRAFIFAQWN